MLQRWSLGWHRSANNRRRTWVRGDLWLWHVPLLNALEIFGPCCYPCGPEAADLQTSLPITHHARDSVHISLSWHRRVPLDTGHGKTARVFMYHKDFIFIIWLCPWHASVGITGGRTCYGAKASSLPPVKFLSPFWASWSMHVVRDACMNHVVWTYFIFTVSLSQGEIIHPRVNHVLSHRG